MSHVVDKTPVSKLHDGGLTYIVSGGALNSTQTQTHDGGLQKLRSAGNVAMNWLGGMAMQAVMK